MEKCRIDQGIFTLKQRKVSGGKTNFRELVYGDDKPSLVFCATTSPTGNVNVATSEIHM